MKKISLILLIFLLSLCLIPPTSAVYGDESPQSITSFSETLPDDVLFYPDFDLEANVSTAAEYIDNMESVTYWDAGGKDWDTWESADGNLHTRHDSVGANEYPLRHMDWDDNDDPDPRPEVTEYDDTTYSWYLRFKVDYNDSADYFRIGFYDTPWGGTIEWFNLLTYSKNVWHYVVYDPTTTMTDLDRIDVNAQLDNGEYAELWLAWIAVIPTANNLDPSFSYDNTSFREGFNDVSDWTQTNGETWGTDGDRMYVDVPYDAGSDFYYTDSISFPAGSYYWELRAETNISYSSLISVTVYDTDGQTGNNKWLGNYYYTSAGQTRKSWFDFDYGIESVALAFTVPVAAGEDARYYTDYFRIFQGNESGWQHDGSTVLGVTGGDGGTTSTDGDSIILIDDGDGSVYDFYIDITTTEAHLQPDYYQFIEISFSSGNSYFRMDSIDESDSTTTITGYTEQGSTTLYRYNLDAAENHFVKLIRLTSYAGHDLVVDYLKVYSIANFTVTQGAVSTSEYIYVDSGVLKYDMDGDSDYIQLDHDPALSVVQSTYPVWNLSISSVGDGTSHSDDYGFRLNAGGWQSWVFDTTRGAMSSGSTTDLRIIGYDDFYLSAIKFIDTRDWQEIGEVEFVIPVGWDPTFIFGYDAFFIFLGLIMIPVSTMYLVRGGREEMSADKLFYGLIIFAVGFGLLVGGIMP